MPNPPSPNRPTPAQALEAARAAAAARTPGQTVNAVTRSASEYVITVRDRAAQWAKAMITPLLRQLDPYDGHAVKTFTETAATHMAIAQRNTAIAAAGSQKQILTTMGIPVTARPSSPLDIRAPGAVFEGGRVALDHGGVSVTYDGDETAHLSAQDLTTVEVLNRPARAIRYMRSQGASPDEALRAGVGRLDTIVDDNMMLSQRFAESEVINLAADQRGSRIVGIRRVIHPELSRSGVCGLCAAASDRLYTVRELLPIHKRCKCTTAAVTEDFDPADALNAIDLSKLYNDAGGTSRAHLKRTRYKIDEHGELGPTLVPERKYKPRTADADSAAPVVHLAQLESKADIAARHLPILEQNLAKLRADGLTEESAQVKYHNAQIETFRADLDAAKLNDPTRQTTTPEPLKGMKAKKKDPKPATAGGGGSGGGRGGGGGNGRGGRGVQSPDGDGNDPQATLRVLKARAQDAEPAASVMVRGVGAETGGTVERFASRFKADASILEKLKRFRQNRPPHYRMDKFNDALRYTLVFDPDSYWQSTRRVVTEIERHGFTVVLDPGGWRTNYQGLNLTVRDEAGRIFEVQLHTAASLRASEQSHGLYEQWRKLKHGDPRRSVLEAQIAAIYEHVPWPPGVPRV